MSGNIAYHTQAKEPFPVIRTPRLLLRQLSQEDTQTATNERLVDIQMGRTQTIQ